jgi:hypothetical protein
LATTKFVGMANDSPLCTADTYGEAYEGVFEIAHKLGWSSVNIWVEEVPHVGDQKE